MFGSGETQEAVPAGCLNPRFVAGDFVVSTQFTHSVF